MFDAFFKFQFLLLNSFYKNLDIFQCLQWVEARELFQQAAELIQAEHRMKKSMWGQFWSAHQRFFKYLCISAKVNHCVDIVQEAVKFGKVVICSFPLMTAYAYENIKHISYWSK